MTKYKRIPVPEQYQNNGSTLLLLTRTELLAICRALIYLDDDSPSLLPLYDWALKTYFEKSTSTPLPDPSVPID